MATFNASANFVGFGALTEIVGENWASLGHQAIVFAGKGLIDTFRICNRYDYDPLSPRGDNMQLRKARFSQEGFFGDD